MDGPPSLAGALPRLGLALSVSVLSGLLVAGLAAPVVGGLGLAAKAQADEFLALPQVLDTPALATRSQVLAADGSLLATFYRVNRVDVEPAAVPASMRSAIIAIEDSRFYEHQGVDYKGIARAAVTNFKSGGVSQGASTLTQQYVKNALLEAATDEAGITAAREQTADRKLREARYALALEKQLSKDEILHRYLEIAYFGNGVYGVGTASTYFFGKPVEQLTLPESATLAGVVQNPTRFDLVSADPQVQEGVRARRDLVLLRMRDTGAITEVQRAEAAAAPLTPVTPPRIGQDCGSEGVVAPFFCDQLRRELEDTPVGAALGATKQERQNALFAGGLTIRTTLDPKVQAAAQRAVDEQVPAGDPSGAGAVSDVVEPGTGAIRAMAVDRAYGDAPGQTKVNLATGGTQGFQPGSTFKVFYLASALQQGIPLSTQIDSPSRYRPEGRNGCPRLGDDGKPYEVGNAEVDEAGVFDLRTGTHLSVNTFYMKLAERTGIEGPVALAEAMGVRKVVDGGRGEAPLDRYCSTVLGAQTVSPLAMAGAYATFAARGVHCTPRAVVGITGPGGREVPVPPPDCRPVLDPGVADTVNSVLTGVIDGGTRGRTGSGASLGRPAAGKTGTTNDSRAAWFVGYTPQLSTAVWVGRLPNPQPMRNIRINGRSYRQVYGGTLPAVVWRQTMREALQDVPAKGFAPADPRVVRGNGNGTDLRGRVPDVSGRGYEQAAQLLSDAGFTPVRARAVPSRLGAGRISYTSPRAGRSARPGSTVYLYPSSGRRAAPAPAAPRPAAPAPAPAPAPPPPQQVPQVPLPVEPPPAAPPPAGPGIPVPGTTS